MRDGIMQLCILAMLCGAAMSICPDGGAKRITNLLCTAVLTSAVLSPIKNIDFDMYRQRAEAASVSENDLIQSFRGFTDTLSEAVMKKELEEYIESKATELGINDFRNDVELCEASDGAYLPYSVRMAGVRDGEQTEKLEAIISDELGIPKERQHWYDEG